jgi:hypothetical protein
VRIYYDRWCQITFDMLLWRAVIRSRLQSLLSILLHHAFDSSPKTACQQVPLVFQAWVCAASAKYVERTIIPRNVACCHTCRRQQSSSMSWRCLGEGVQAGGTLFRVPGPCSEPRRAESLQRSRAAPEDLQASEPCHLDPLFDLTKESERGGSSRGSLNSFSD